MNDKESTIAMRNAFFIAGDCMPLDSFMLGSIMAQTRLVVEAAESPEQATEILAYYFSISMESVPAYWSDRAKDRQP